MARTPGKGGAFGKDGGASDTTESMRRKLRAERQERLKRFGNAPPPVIKTQKPKLPPSNRDYPTTLTLGDSDPRVVRPLVIPFPIEKIGAGRRFLRPIVTRLERAAAIHVLRAYDLLMARDDMTTETTLPIVESVTPRSLDYMQRLARVHMRENHLTSEGIDRLARILMVSDMAMAETHLALAKLLGTSLTKAQRIVDAADAALKVKDGVEAEKLLHAAFRAEPSSLRRIHLVRISAAANINAAVLWPQFIEDMPVIEVARFAANLMLGAYRSYDNRYSLLRRPLFPEARLLLGDDSNWPGHSDVIEALALARELLKSCRESATLLGAIECSYIAGIDLVIGEGRAKTSTEPVA
jgi:hypothetical protein